jgi:dihydroflavonol-4-reductase
MTILVTGGTGHIGNVLIRELVQTGQPVRALVLPGEDRSILEDVPVEWVEGDVLDPASLTGAFTGVDTVYHLAGIISILPGRNELVRRVNVEGTKNVLEAARAAGVRRLVYTSSIHAFQRAPHGVVVDETLPFDPLHALGPYDCSKAEASLEVLKAAQDGLDAVVVAPTGVIGPHDFRVSEMGALIRSWLRPDPAVLIDGRYDFVDVRDVVRGEMLAAEKGRRGEVYILSGQQIHLVQMLCLVKQALDLPVRVLTIPLRWARFFARFAVLYYRMSREKPRFTPYSIETVRCNSVISHAKAERELGYQPRALEQSLRDTAAWWKQYLLSKKARQAG